MERRLRRQTAYNRRLLLVGRERAHGGVNGDLYTLVGHRDDGRLELVRRRDAKPVVWDMHEHRAIDHGYATTSYGRRGAPSIACSRWRRRLSNGGGCMLM